MLACGCLLLQVGRLSLLYPPLCLFPLPRPLCQPLQRHGGRHWLEAKRQRLRLQMVACVLVLACLAHPCQPPAMPVRIPLDTVR